MYYIHMLKYAFVICIWDHFYKFWWLIFVTHEESKPEQMNTVFF